MKILTLLFTLFLASVESQLSAREDREWRPFGSICWEVRVYNAGTEEDRSFVLEGLCGRYREKKRMSLPLDDCVGNEDGALVWRKGFVSLPPRLLVTEPGQRVLTVSRTQRFL